MVGDARRPLVTIGIPTFERTKYIAKALESCLSQTHDNLEIIVHDDTPDDAIRSIVSSYRDDRIQYLQNKPMLGLVAKLNDMLERARGEWLLILCDDDVFEPQLVEELVGLSRSHPDATLLRARNRLINEHDQELALDVAWPEVLDAGSFLERLFLPPRDTITMNLTGMMFRPEQLKALGGFANLYRGWHVDRLAWALLGAQGTVISSDKAMCKIRVYPGTITSGLAPNYLNALEADLAMKTVIDELIASKYAAAPTESEKQKLERAEAAFDVYMRRHMSRSLDHGLLAALANPDANKHADLLRTMNEHNIPPFATFHAYRLLRHLPLWMRRVAAARIFKYKQHWLTPGSRPLVKLAFRR